MGFAVGLVFITIHKGVRNDLVQTVSSIAPLLDLNLISGYIIYESDSSHLSDSNVLKHPKVTYKHSQPSEGISAALNASQRLADFVEQCTHHMFVHSGDRLDNVLFREYIDDVCASASINDLVFFHHILQMESFDSTITRPSFSSIRRSMTVAHVGTIISNKLHNVLGGYSTMWLYAMDYDFMLRASLVSGIRYVEHGLAICVMNERGASALHAYKAISEVCRIRMRYGAGGKGKKLRYSIDFLLDCLKRFAYEYLAHYPALRGALRKRLNKNLVTIKAGS